MGRKKQQSKRKAARSKKSTAQMKMSRAAQKSRAKKTAGRRPRVARGKQTRIEMAALDPRVRSYSAGQSGDVQGLSEEDRTDSESVAELAEEGQGFEAGVVSGIENAPDADQGEIRTREVPEDDVPAEYRERD